MTVGLTGGIGSGKSTISEIFKTLGISVFDADREAKLCYKEEQVRSQVIELLGAEAYVDGEVNRGYVAQKVFSNEQLLAKLNSIIHPATAARFIAWKKNQHAPYVVREAAILLESGSYEDCDSIILVTASLEERVSRVMARNGVERQEVEARISNQWSDERKQGFAQFVIRNDAQDELIPQVMEIHRKLIEQVD